MFINPPSYEKLRLIVNKSLLALNVLLITFFFGWIIIYYTIVNTNHFSMVQLIAKKLIKMHVEPFVIRGLSNTGTKYYLSSASLSNYMESFFTDTPILLKKPKLFFLNKKNENITVEASTGNFDAKRKMLNLLNNVHIIGDNQLNYYLSSATVDLNTNIIYSNDKTNGVYKNINMTSGGFIFYNHENIIIKGPFTMSTQD